MANQKVIVAGSDITAKQKAEFWNKVVSGHINRENFQKFLDEADGRFDPNKFFVICKGLQISDSFKKDILSTVKKIKPIRLPEKCVGFDLPRPMDNIEIALRLGGGYIFNTSEVCLVIASMISSQANGDKGQLNDVGKNNLICRGTDGKIFVASVNLSRDTRIWNISATDVDSVSTPWCPGCRVFSRKDFFPDK